MSTIIGEPYAGLSPVHVHRTLPVATSNAVRAASPGPPTCTIMTSPSTIGDIAVGYIGCALVAGFCESCLPVAASNAVTMLDMAREKSRPLANVGVDFGPGP